MYVHCHSWCSGADRQRSGRLTVRVRYSAARTSTNLGSTRCSLRCLCRGAARSSIVPAGYVAFIRKGSAGLRPSHETYRATRMSRRESAASAPSATPRGGAPSRLPEARRSASSTPRRSKTRSRYESPQTGWGSPLRKAFVTFEKTLGTSPRPARTSPLSQSLCERCMANTGSRRYSSASIGSRASREPSGCGDELLGVLLERLRAIRAAEVIRLAVVLGVRRVCSDDKLVSGDNAFSAIADLGFAWCDQGLRRRGGGGVRAGGGGRRRRAGAPHGEEAQEEHALDSHAPESTRGRPRAVAHGR
jgi:hypothetical protein